MFKVLVTGGSGFVGKNLLEILSLKKYLVYQAFYDIEKRLIDRVRIFNNKEIEPLIDFENIKKIDYIIHCAAKLPNFSKNKHSNFDEYQKSNVELTLLTAKQAVSKGIKRFVYISSALASNSKKVKKNSIKDFYAVSKLESEIRLMEFSKQTGLEVVILRPPLIYGKYVKGSFLTLLNLISKQLPLPFKNIKVLRSYVGIDNLVDLIIVCMSHPKATGQTLYVSDTDISLNDLVIIIAKYMKKSSNLFSLPLPLLKLIAHLTFKVDQYNSVTETFLVDNTNTNKLLGWRPLYNLDYGIEKLVHWYQKKQ
jgi:nucleoside-diphosphate-sugar epimerase